jgi:DNA-directed RNA polymerase subunit RPC12/RpoP
MTCPQCGGRLTYDIALGAVTCQNCNYHKVISIHAYDNGALLAETLLKRKYQAQRWKATEHLLKCSNCGAVVTLPARAMTDRCFFCNSQRVLVSDSAETLEQPDGIIPFSISERQAIAAVNKAMNSGLRALTRFLRHPISHCEARGLYLPFWAFDAVVDVHWSYPGVIEGRGMEQVLMNDMLAAASHTLQRELLEQIEPFDLRQMQRYDPRYLADWPAEIYQLDVDEASLNARAAMSREARTRVRPRLPASKNVVHEYDEIGGAYWPRETSGDYYQTSRLQLSTRISGMTYRLVLLPVWSVQLHEKGGHVRRALVNGQTGKVALSGPLGGRL